MSKVLVFISSGLLEVFELTLARAIDLYEDGNKVTLLYCDGSIQAGCTANPFGWASVCKTCNKVYKKAFESLPQQITIQPISVFRLIDNKYSELEWTLVEKNIKNGVNSTILTNYRMDNLKVNNSYLLKLIDLRFTAYSKFIFECAIKLIKEIVFDRLEFYNGRLVPTRSLLVAAKMLNKEFFTLESWGAKRSIRIYKNATPHEIQHNKQALENYINNKNLDLDLGNKFFINRREGRRTNDRPYTTNQIKRPYTTTNKKPILSFFLSSPDELKVSGDEFFTTWSLKPEKFIIESYILLCKNFDFIVRMHPNQHGDKTGNTEGMIRAFEKVKPIRLIKPLDPASTYGLLDISSCVVTFGSTLGIEATYWGKASILVGRAIWESSEVVYKCNNPIHLVALLNSNLKPLSHIRVKSIGTYLMSDIDSSYHLSVSKSGFHVTGNNYLTIKRRGIGVIFNKLIEKIIKKFL